MIHHEIPLDRSEDENKKRRTMYSLWNNEERRG
jgi:hypothetical protein